MSLNTAVAMNDAVRDDVHSRHSYQGYDCGNLIFPLSCAVHMLLVQQLVTRVLLHPLQLDQRVTVKVVVEHHTPAKFK